MTQMARYYGKMRDLIDPGIWTVCYICRKCDTELWTNIPEGEHYDYEIECKHCANTAKKRGHKNETTNH